MPACTACGGDNAPGQRFCGSCGAPLRPAPVAHGPVVERRVCSVLFADLVGFTPLAETRDPEDVRDMLSRYFDTARTVIARYGGVVEKFIGDAVMAVWGTPVAAEEDAERAVRAGLDLVAAVAALGEELGEDGLCARAGVVTGPVAATLGAIGEGMVAGDAVNTAARVQAAAEPGTVWADATTQRLARAGVGFRAAGTHLLKGKAGPLPLWRATRVLSSVGGAQRVDGPEAPWTGRAAADRALREAFHDVVDTGRPRLVVVTGPAGVGKSRLGWEFEKYSDGLAHRTWWHRGRCVSYGEGVAYWALATAVRQRLDIAEEDAAVVVAAKLAAGLDRLVPDPEERRFAGVRLGRLLGLAHPDDTGVTLGPGDLFAGWRVLFERLAQTAPVALLVEDAQHADDGLLDFLVDVTDRSRHPILLVAFARPELLERRPDLVDGRRRTVLDLGLLPEADVLELVAGLLPGVAAEALHVVAARAQGNPLFAVETVRSLVDRGAIVASQDGWRVVTELGALTVPETLHGLLAARLDALDPPLHDLVSHAAVLGTSFPGPALAAVSGRGQDEVDEALHELVRRGILTVSTDPLSPQRGSYVFAQTLFRQVAYETLSRRDRRTRHLAVAEHLQRVFPDAGEEVMDVVAQHYLDALDSVAAPDDAEVRSRAVRSLVRAAERSRRIGAPAAAARALDRAADLVGGDDRLAAAELYVRSMEEWGSAGLVDAAVERGHRARDLARACGASRQVARFRAATAVWVGRGRRQEEAIAELTAVLPELHAVPDAVTVRALGALARLQALTGRPEEAVRLAAEALRLTERVDVDRADLLTLYGVAALSETFSMRLDRSVEFGWRAVRLADQLGDRREQARRLNNLAAALVVTDPQAALATAQEAVRLCRLTSDGFQLPITLATAAEVQLVTGAWFQLRRDIEQTKAAGDLAGREEDVDVMLGGVLALHGELEAARAVLALPGLRASADVGDAMFVAWADAVLAWSAGDVATALRHALEVVGSREQSLSSVAALWAWPLAVRCAAGLGDRAEVQRLIAYLDGHPVPQLPALLAAERTRARAHLDGDRVGLVAAVLELRAAASPYHLAHGLLDLAVHPSTGEDEADELRSEALTLATRLGAADVTTRAAAGVPARP